MIGIRNSCSLPCLSKKCKVAFLRYCFGDEARRILFTPSFDSDEGRKDCRGAKQDERILPKRAKRIIRARSLFQRIISHRLITNSQRRAPGSCAFRKTSATRRKHLWRRVLLNTQECLASSEGHVNWMTVAIPGDPQIVLMLFGLNYLIGGSGSALHFGLGSRMNLAGESRIPVDSRPSGGGEWRTYNIWFIGLRFQCHVIYTKFYSKYTYVTRDVSHARPTGRGFKVNGRQQV